MFQSIWEIQRLNTSIEQLEKQKQTLKQLYTKSKKNSGKLEKEVSSSVESIIWRAKQKLQLCEKLEKEIMQEQFIHGSFDVRDLVFNIQQLPQWFTFVFEKQFDKERRNLSAMAKRLYTQHGLKERKYQLINEISSFENLNKRYEGLNKVQKNGININSEAESFQNKTSMIFTKFIQFIELIGKKIHLFVQQNAKKSVNFVNSNSKSSYQPAETSLSYCPPPNFDRELDHRAASKDRYRGTVMGFADINRLRTTNLDLLEMKPNKRGASTSNMNSCMNHPHYHEHQHHYHRPLTTKGFDEGASRFNYRDHAPKLVSGSLSNFYY